jgi:hypothetical protein
MTKAWSTPKPMVGTTIRRVVQEGPPSMTGRPSPLDRVLGDARLRDLKPELEQFAWLRGAPQSGFSTLIHRINTRSSVSICGRPPRGRDFQRQPALCQRTSVSGRMIVRTFRIAGNRRYSWKEPAIMVREPNATTRPAPQDNQKLMSKHRVLGFNP